MQFVSSFYPDPCNFGAQKHPQRWHSTFFLRHRTTSSLPTPPATSPANHQQASLFCAPSRASDISSPRWPNKITRASQARLIISTVQALVLLGRECVRYLKFCSDSDMNNYTLYRSLCMSAHDGDWSKVNGHPSSSWEEQVVTEEGKGGGTFGAQRNISSSMRSSTATQCAVLRSSATRAPVRCPLASFFRPPTTSESERSTHR